MHDVHDEDEMDTPLVYNGNKMSSSYLRVSSPVPFLPQIQAFSVIVIKVMLIR